MAERFTDYEMKVRAANRKLAWKLHMRLARTAALDESQGIRSPRPVPPGDTIAYALEAQDMIIDWEKAQLQYKRAQAEAKARGEKLSATAERQMASQLVGLYGALGGVYIRSKLGLKGKFAEAMGNAMTGAFDAALMSRFPEELSDLGEKNFQQWLTENDADINGAASSTGQSVPGWRTRISSGSPLPSAGATGSSTALLNSLFKNQGGLIRGVDAKQQEALISRVESHLGLAPESLRSWIHKGVNDYTNAPGWAQVPTGFSSAYDSLGKDVGAASERLAATREKQADEALAMANEHMSRASDAASSTEKASIKAFFTDVMKPMVKEMREIDNPVSAQIATAMTSQVPIASGGGSEEAKARTEGLNRAFLDSLIEGAGKRQGPKTIGEVDLEYVQGPRANPKAEVMYERDIPMDDIFKSFGRAKEGATKKNLKKWTEKMQRIPGSTVEDLQALEGLDPTQQKLLYKQIKKELKKGERKQESADLSSATTKIVGGEQDNKTNVIPEAVTEIEEVVDPALAILAKKIAQTAIDKQKVTR